MALAWHESRTRPLRRDRPTLLGALLVVPAVFAVFGNWAIFRLFGDEGGTHLAPDTFGYALSDFWDAGGLGLVAGLAAFAFVLLRRRGLGPAAALGVAAAALAYLYWFVTAIVALLLNPGALS